MIVVIRTGPISAMSANMIRNAAALHTTASATTDAITDAITGADGHRDGHDAGLHYVVRR